MQIPEQIVRTLVKPNGSAPPKPTIDCGEPAFKIDCGVPITAIKQVTRAQNKTKQYNGEYPFDQLKPPRSDGQQYSFFVPAPKPKDVAHFANKLGISARGYAVAYDPKAKYTRRQVVENGVVGVRVWRTK